MKKKIIIIGGGWYGCHIANLLMNKYDITMLEQKDDIFNNSSYFNQNRLHLGFHYSRNYPTRLLCKNNYNIFFERYAEIIENIDKNYYVISKDSILDLNTYVSIFKHENFDFDLIDNNNLFTGIENKLIRVDEKVINSDKAYKYFKKNLKYINKLFNKKVISYSKINELITVNCSDNTEYECDILLDCTYNQLGLSKKEYTYEITCSLLFKKINNIEFGAITIMDGKFSSLYPRDIENDIYTLTDVEHTPILKTENYDILNNYIVNEKEIIDTKEKMISKFKKYYPDFEKNFQYEGYFLSKKTKVKSISDSRDIVIDEIEPNVISVNCGKIYGIFEWEKYILDKLNISE